MRVRTQELGCLAHKAYLVEDQGEAMVIDPPRDVDAIVRLIEAEGLKLRYVVESHLHADFVSGHVELAKRTGATIVLSEKASASFPFHPAKDGEFLPLGGLKVEVMYTPGHTPFDLCLFVTDPAAPEEAPKLFTGDTLFYGDIGRPDLVAAKGFSQEEMAKMMYRTLHGARFQALPDATEVYPAHGAGSACGKAIADLASSTLGEQRATNWALQPMDEATFIQQATSGLGLPPAYFGHDVAMNMAGALPLNELPAAPLLEPAAFASAMESPGAYVLDVRASEAFAQGHVQGSVNVDLDGNFAPWVGAVVPFESQLLLVVDSETHLNEARIRLARVGYDRVAGVLAGGVSAWAAEGRPVGSFVSLSPEEAVARIAAGARVVDVRSVAEHAEGHLEGAIHMPLPELSRRVGELPAGPLVVHCAGGVRSRVAWGVMAKAGLPVEDMAGGYKGWQAAGLPVQVPAGV